MEEVINKNDFSEALQAFKSGAYDAQMLMRKFDELRSSVEDISEQSLSEINNLIDNAELPDELAKQLSAAVTDPKTRIYVAHDEADKTDAHSESHSSSLLKELLKWSKGDENKEIQIGQTIRDTYRLVSRIGKGGMGEVWKAIDLIQDAGDSSDKYVAIKFINHEIRSHPYALKALVREFARYKKLIHPNIVKAYELNRDESEVFIVMEYLEGIPLKDFIKQHPDGISLAEAKPIIGGMCKALNYAHQEGIIHLDFKPGNVFYDPQSNTAKVIDFGIARLSKQSDRDKTRFDPGSLGAVSTAYASVEMLLLEDNPDPRDDIYGLACVAYELLSGKHAYNGIIATKAERDKMQPKPVKKLRHEEFQALLKGLTFSRDARTASAELFFQDLYKPQISARQKRTRWLVIAAILIVTLISAPMIVNKGYDFWKKNQIIEAIENKQITGIKKFQSLPLEQQLNLLLDKELLSSIIEFSISDAVTDAIKFIHGFKPAIQDNIFKNQDVRDILINHYIESINQALANDNFDQAILLSNNIIDKYPDSKSLADQMEQLLSWKTERLGELENNYQQCITDLSKSLVELMPCLQSTFNGLNKIAPEHKILVDPELVLRFEKEISTAVQTGSFPLAENLLHGWRTLIKTETPQREEIEQTIIYQKKIFTITEKLMASDNKQLQDIIPELLKLEAGTRTDLFNQPVANKKILAYFDQKVTNELDAKNYSAAFKYIETAFALYADIPNQQQPLQQLNNKIRNYKKQYLEELARNYQAILASEEFDVKALQNLQRQISSIEPKSPLVKFPGVAKAFARHIDNAINNEQFDSAFDYLEKWKKIKPADSQSKQLLSLSKKYHQHLNSYNNRMAIQKQLSEALKTEQASNVNKVIKELQSNYPEVQKQRVINELQEPLLQFYKKQIQTAIDKHAFTDASTMVDEALILLPDDKFLLQSKNLIANEKNQRIEELQKAFQLALNSETADGKQVFSYLIELRNIDGQYLEKNPQSYQILKLYLLNLAKNEQALDKLRDLTTQWDKFFNDRDNSQKAKKAYRQTRNLIALRCLYTGRKLKKQGQHNLANDFLRFGLSLDPVATVENSLKKELQEIDAPAINVQ